MEYSYRVIATDKIEQLQKEISELMLNEWEFHGDLRVCANKGKTLFVQVMINREIVTENLRKAGVIPSKEEAMKQSEDAVRRLFEMARMSRPERSASPNPSPLNT
jgi:hypothetical protein